MNNAGVGAKGTSWSGLQGWHDVFDVNLFGLVRFTIYNRDTLSFIFFLSFHFGLDRVLNIQQTFVPSLIHQENQAMIINTGSKQGITNPPCVPCFIDFRDLC